MESLVSLAKINSEAFSSWTVDIAGSGSAWALLDHPNYIPPVDQEELSS